MAILTLSTIEIAEKHLCHNQRSFADGARKPAILLHDTAIWPSELKHTDVVHMLLAMQNNKMWLLGFCSTSLDCVQETGEEVMD